jgi:allantoin racemase
MKILVLIPMLKNDTSERETRKELARIKNPTVQYTVRSLKAGPASIESEFDDRLASPYVIEEVARAEREGFEAVFVSCMGDVATSAAREAVQIPVIAPCQACMAVASTLGDKFGVVTIVENLVPVFFRKAKEYGFLGNLAGVQNIGVPVLELNRRRTEVVQALIRGSRDLIDNHQADSIILGCTGLLGIATALRKKIEVPVLDPTPVSIKFAEMLVVSGISHSAKAFMRPPKKVRKLANLPYLAGISNSKPQ